MALLGSAINQLKPVIDMVLKDPSLKEMITYRKYAGQAFKISQGHAANVYSEYRLSAVRLEDRRFIQAIGTGAIQAGNPCFLCRGEDIPEGASVKDLVVDGTGKTLKVKEIRNLLGVAFALMVESD